MGIYGVCRGRQGRVQSGVSCSICAPVCTRVAQYGCAPREQLQSALCARLRRRTLLLAFWGRGGGGEWAAHAAGESGVAEGEEWRRRRATEGGASGESGAHEEGAAETAGAAGACGGSGRWEGSEESG